MGIIFCNLSFFVLNICVFVFLQQISFVFSFPHFLVAAYRFSSVTCSATLLKSLLRFSFSIAHSKFELYSFHPKRFALYVYIMFASFKLPYIVAEPYPFENLAFVSCETVFYQIETFSSFYCSAFSSNMLKISHFLLFLSI